jgi:hypothetical protein
MRNLTAILAFIGLLSLGVGLAPTPAQAAAQFRILDVRTEYGHLVVEVEHFKPDGSFAYFENYLWQGREGLKREIAKDAAGFLLLEDNTRAPTKLAPSRRQEQYKPAGKAWKRSNRVPMVEDSITSVIQQIHNERAGQDWTKGQNRLTVTRQNFKEADTEGLSRLAAKFRRMKGTAYRPADPSDPESMMLAYTGPLPPPNPGGGEFERGTVSTFYPSLDGWVADSASNVTFTTLVNAAGGFSDDSSPTNFYLAIMSAGNVTDRWNNLYRGVALFDTQTLPDGDAIDSAVLGTRGKSRGQGAGALTLNVYTSAPASDSALVAGDYDSLGTTALSDTGITYAAYSTVGYNNFALNATGIAQIDKTGISKFGFRDQTYDATDTAPGTWASTYDSYFHSWPVEETNPTEHRPKLVVTHTAPTAAITGTIGDGATEQEVRDGGGTIIITLTGDTWVAAGGTFNAQRQAIIDGLDSAQSETYGWNAEVRDEMGVASVVRTSSTIVTVTVAASDVADYRIDDPDVVTVTVPAAALVTSSDAITATPTFTVTGAAESVTVAGTLGASGGTAAEVRAGGETITLTLANTKWVASGATFNAQRQNIIDGLDSNQADQNGWDNRRTDFAVGDVVRTSDTQVTITLSASTAYAIPQTETITAVVPASALVYGAALTGAPAFNIVPAFQLDGNRVSPAIDLSSITNVAYCALGWQAATPAGTSVTVVTSIDGGANYSTATNGECPTGITVGGSLSTISDFRIRVTLATSDNTVTPLVEALALLVQDVSGPALLYQLNTVPGITITDRSANSNTGTMSFPVSQTGVNATTGVLESTRSTLSLEQLLSVGDIVSPVTGAAVSGNLFSQDETGFGSLPFQDLMQTMATGGELPLRFIWVVAIGLFSIALGVVALHFTGSLMISGIGLGAGLSIGAAIGGGLIPGWTVILFVILALALVVMRSRGSLPL